MQTSAIRKIRMLTRIFGRDLAEGLLEDLAVEELLADRRPAGRVDDDEDDQRRRRRSVLAVATSVLRAPPPPRIRDPRLPSLDTG